MADHRDSAINHLRHRRRGVTLLEMLVTLAVLLIMMTAIVQIFQAATGTLSASRAYQELDNGLRRLDSTIRADFAGVTAKMTPPLNPKDNRGYFEYGENAFADLQGEDSDDYVRFTTKAPADRPFIGRFWPNGSTTPISITSQYAEVIYFLRNGNLYRRVFLIAPERQKSVSQTSSFLNSPLLPGKNVSWLGMNDLSARPSAAGTGIVLNTLGDLTNRENRAFSPRFANDFVTTVYDSTNDSYTVSNNSLADQTPDDLNVYVNGLNTRISGDGVPDFYPSLYYNLFLNPPNRLIYEGGNITNPPLRTGANAATMAFPYVFPGAYSHPDPQTRGSGWLHSPNPISNAASQLVYLRQLNHNPLDVGDNLPRPAATGPNGNTFGGLQTWWGFPTWRETLSVNWTDPTDSINASPYNQPPGLTPRNVPPVINATTGAVLDTADLLPPMAYSTNQSLNAAQFNIIRSATQPYADGLGGVSAFMDLPWSNTASNTHWAASWEDDLIMTGVRSFDIKALDSALGEYADLGWGDDARLPISLPNGQTYYEWNGNAAPFMTANPTMIRQTIDASNVPVFTFGNASVFGAARPSLIVNNQFVDLLNGTFAHEGRMPPLVNDHRLDAQFPNPTYGMGKPVEPEYSAYNAYSSNIGDNNANIVRLRRVWDSWSTDYSAAPARGFDPQTKAPIGPPFSPPVYPSYPPPYPAPLRGIQIQIRVQDPTGKYVKSLTIRQDFTEKL